VNSFGTPEHANATSKDILVKQVWFGTNDAWPIISAGRPLAGGTSGVPIVLRALYSLGNIWVLTIPSDYGDLYEYPEFVLDTIRSLTASETGIYITGPAKVSLFLYDNGYLIVENFNDYGARIGLHFKQASDLVEDGDGTNTFTNVQEQQISLAPHQFRVFRATPSK
jgi:hypothetical protein